jgi:cytochrome bd-type quinol oxidase subunit 2
MEGYGLLVYFALAAVVVVIIAAAFVIRSTPDDTDLDARKIRFAAATFTGILMLFIFTAVLYFVDSSGRGKEIFDKAFTAITPLAGAIIGYFFGVKK